MLAQIPLNDMYHEALNAAVKVRTKAALPAEVAADFLVDQALDRSFMTYASWTVQYDERQNVATAGGAPENRMAYHTHLYWRWRAHVSPIDKFRALSSFQNADAQDKVDLWESELDWRRDVEVARRAAEPQYDYTPTIIGPVRSATKRSHATVLQQRILQQVAKAAQVPEPVSEFFDRYVHDSHAGFWMLGPRTRLDKQALIAEIKERQRMHDLYLRLAQQAGDMDYETRVTLESMARSYELNQFERRVLAADAASPGSMPVFTDADAAEMRRRAGFMTSATMRLMGTATRREASGHGRYRRIFDRS